jgi:cardiolipin synthase
MKQLSGNRVVTIPNLISFARALGIPLFIVLGLSGHHDGWAVFVLTVGGISDYLDGKLARILNQYSRLGELLDPAVDRLYILATLLVLTSRELLPIWIVVLLIARDVILGIYTLALNRKKFPPMTVTFMGKAATFNLLYAFPFLLLGASDNWLGTIGYIIGWSFGIWGIALYLFTGLQYARTAQAQLRQIA